MDRSTLFYLVENEATQNANGEFVAGDTTRAVFGDVRSVSRAEFFAAGAEGLRPEYQVSMFAPDYEGEKLARLEIGGTMYQFAIYRTYFDGNNETVELYLGDRVGVSAVELGANDGN
ncbi:MAG: hypothetical protein IJG87_02320 [Ruminococcus sp.]|nr:hypothetical protein [Ruminococcus sp.]